MDFTRGLELRNLELPANGANCALLNFSMSRNGSDFAVSRILPDWMIATFARQEAAVSAEVPLQIEPLHEAAN